MATFLPGVAEDRDRDVIWDKRTWELLRAAPVELAGLTCADCRRVREPHLLRRNRRTGEWHCYDGEACLEAIAANNAPWSEAERATCDAVPGRALSPAPVAAGPGGAGGGG